MNFMDFLIDLFMGILILIDFHSHLSQEYKVLPFIEDSSMLEQFHTVFEVQWLELSQNGTTPGCAEAETEGIVDGNGIWVSFSIILWFCHVLSIFNDAIMNIVNQKDM